MHALHVGFEQLKKELSLKLFGGSRETVGTVDQKGGCKVNLKKGSIM